MPRRDASPDTRQASSETQFELGALFEFSNIVNGTLDIRFILSHFLLTLMGKLLSLRGMILLEESPGLFAVHTVKGLPGAIAGTTVSIPKTPKRLLTIDTANAEKHPWTALFATHGLRLAVPLLAQEKVVGIAGFAPSILKKKLTAKQERYIRSLANIAASAVEKGLILEAMSQVNRQLDGKIQQLNTLFELSKEFSVVLEQDRLVKLLMYAIMGQVGANRFMICLEHEGHMNVVASRLEKPVNPELCAMFPGVTSPTTVDALTRKGQREWQSMLREIGIHALVPLQIQQKTRGILGLGEKMRGGGYTKTDLDFLFSLGNLAIISLENARLFKEAIEKQRLEDDLLIAKEIQRGLLPAQLPHVPGFDLEAINISSKQVGGDYYDVITMDNERFVLAIGDVSGKGTPASLLMANLQATIRALVPLGLPLADLTKRVNDLLCENTGLDRFITFFWGILDAPRRRFKYVSAGHNPPFLVRASGAVERLDKGGIILGIMKTIVPYQEGEVSLGPGDVLVLFTDGVSEAMDASGGELGEEKLEAVIRRELHSSAEAILSGIVNTVEEHSSGTTQYDDITLVVLKTKP